MLVRLEAFSIENRASNQTVQANVSEMHVTIRPDVREHPKDRKAYAIYDNKSIDISNSERFYGLDFASGSYKPYVQYWRSEQIDASYTLRFTYNGSEYSYSESNLYVEIPDKTITEPIYVESGRFAIGWNTIYPITPWLEYEYKHLDIRWVSGNYSGDIIIADNTQFSQIAGIPVSFYLPGYIFKNGDSSIPVTISVSGTFSGRYNGRYDTYKYSTSRVYTCSVPADYTPSINSVSINDTRGYYAAYGAYLQNVSVIHVDVNASFKYDAVLRSCSISCDGKTYNGTSVDLAVSSYGNVQINVTVVDSRGTSATWSGNIIVARYYYPTVNFVQLYRSNQSGISDQSGAYATVGFSDNVCPITVGGVNKNTVEKRRIFYRKRGDTAFSYVDVNSSSFSLTNHTVIIPVSAENDYEFYISTMDKLRTSNSLYKTLPAAFLLIDFDKGSKSIGFGRMANAGNRISVGLDMYMGGHTIHDLGSPVHDDDAVPMSYIKNIYDAIYPVGSIYMSMNQTCAPAALITDSIWERIEGRFLLGAGDGYSAGATGGEANHTLTIDEIPSHTHSYKLANDYGADSGSNAVQDWARDDTLGRSFTTGEAGGSGSHNNMPPYLVVYMWKRTK